MERPKLDLKSEKGHTDTDWAGLITLGLVAGLTFSTTYQWIHLRNEVNDINSKLNIPSAPVARDIGSFENSFNSELQLTPTPQP